MNSKKFEEWFATASDLDKWQPKAAYEAGQRQGMEMETKRVTKIAEHYVIDEDWPYFLQDIEEIKP